MPVRIGVDLGGTKIEITALDASRREIFRRRVPTPAGDYVATIDAVSRLIHDADSELGTLAPVGVGTPGAPSRENGLIKNANSAVLIGKPLKADLETKIGRAIRMTNDANCFALSEAVDGAAQTASTVFGVILGTGVGGGIAVDKQILEGANAIAGEWGHNPLPWPEPDELPGPVCYCGKRGCIESFLCGPALTREYREQTKNELTPTEIGTCAAAGDLCARQCLATYMGRLARSLATVINILDPELVVFGGGVSKIEALYDSLPPLLQPWVFSDTVRTRLVAARHGDSSGVRGAAMLWP